MAHFKLVSDSTMLVDYSTPAPGFAIFVCSTTVRDHIERRRPAKRRFKATSARNAFWFAKFSIYAGVYPDMVEFARNGKGVWYARATFA